LLSIAKVHLTDAFENFKADERVPWGDLTGNVPKVRVQVWIDALKATIPQFELQERWLS
jgi:hypothetical protein